MVCAQSQYGSGYNVYSQHNDGSIQSPLPVAITGVASFVDQRGNRYIADDQPLKTSPSTVDPGIRVLQFPASSGVPSLGTRTAFFGSTSVGYGQAQLEVTRDDNIVISYTRVGPSIGSEADYAIWLAGQRPFEATALMQAGTHTLGTCSGSCPTISPGGDTGTIALAAPQDTIYMFAPYAASDHTYHFAANFFQP